MDPTRTLHELGQSLWLDNITRDLVASGTLARYIDELSVTGLTSNPTIFDHAIKGSTAYDDAIRAGRAKGRSGEALFFDLALDDLTRAADLLRPTFERTCGVDGFVSLEVSPLLAYDTATTIAAAKALHARAARPNLFIKIPGTREGLPAIEEATFAGVPVNVTLLFSREQYLAAAQARLAGIERRTAAGLPPDVPSVASLFVSRWDVAVAGLPRAARLAARAARPERRRAAAAAAAREHRNQGSRGIRRPVRGIARRAADGQHDAGSNAQGVCRSRPRRRADARRRRRLRDGTRGVRAGGCGHRRARGHAAARRRRGVRQVVDRSDGRDHGEVRGSGESVATAGAMRIVPRSGGQEEKRR
jgi:transaldolase